MEVSVHIHVHLHVHVQCIVLSSSVAVNNISSSYNGRCTVRLSPGKRHFSDRSVLHGKTVPFCVYGLDSVPRLFT